MAFLIKIYFVSSTMAAPSIAQAQAHHDSYCFEIVWRFSASPATNIIVLSWKRVFVNKLHGRWLCCKWMRQSISLDSGAQRAFMSHTDTQQSCMECECFTSTLFIAIAPHPLSGENSAHHKYVHLSGPNNYFIIVFEPISRSAMLALAQDVNFWELN